ncbi:MAG: molybdopterin-dependent oxidoreductase [Chloroflexi bacterium]|nr:molybdopterin-dependent oxidoreductase [Chloroflexota bacterium]
MAVQIGDSVRRKEDPRLITGNGTYVDDVVLPGLLHLSIVRSPYAHAKIKRIDVSAATNTPGVVAAFTAADLAGQLGSLPLGWVVEGTKQPDHPPLAIDTVRYVGDAVAVIVAEEKAIAADAAELVNVDYEELPVVVDAEEAQKPDAPQLHEEAPGNVAFEWEVNGGDWDAAAREAEVVVKQKIINQRLIPNAMETRGVVADYNPGTDQITMWTSTQIPHLVRLLFCLATGHPESRLRVIAPEVGGAFGSKLYLYAEEVITGIVAKQLGRPVKWIEGRQENYQATTHGRDHITYAEIIGNRDGKILGLRCTVHANVGGYLSTFAPLIPTIYFGLMLTGVYNIPAIGCKTFGVFTNTTPVDAYRGAGRPEATYLVERMVDLFAQEIKRDPVAVRRKNLIKPFKRGHEVPTGVMYDTGNYRGTLNKALEMFDYRGFRKEQRAARREGRLLGVGFSCYVEISGAAPSAVAASLGAGAGLWESNTVRVHPTGSVTIYIGTSPHGQGHETSFAQIASAELGIDIDDIEVLHGDTDRQQFGTGTFGSRSIAVGGGALSMSLKKVVAKAKKIAAHQLGVSDSQVELVNGNFIVEDIPERSMGFAAVAGEAYHARDLPRGMEPGLEATSFFDPENFTWPFGCHIAVVEIDQDTGDVKLTRYIGVDDVGNIINPMILAGMVHGGAAQGIGQALWERAVYSDDGQLLTGSMLDYAVPNSINLPNFELGHTVTPTPVNPLGAKGAGETGTIAATPAIVNACVDALKHIGVTHIDMPVTSEKVWRLLDAAGKARPRRK